MKFTNYVAKKHELKEKMDYDNTILEPQGQPFIKRKWLEITKHLFINGWPWGSRIIIDYYTRIFTHQPVSTTTYIVILQSPPNVFCKSLSPFYRLYFVDGEEKSDYMTFTVFFWDVSRQFLATKPPVGHPKR